MVPPFGKSTYKWIMDISEYMINDELFNQNTGKTIVASKTKYLKE